MSPRRVYSSFSAQPGLLCSCRQRQSSSGDHLLTKYNISKAFFSFFFLCHLNECSFGVPPRVRLRSSAPLASSSWLQTPRKSSPAIGSSPLKLLPLCFVSTCPHRAELAPLSAGNAAAMFHTSLSALAFNVAAPRRAAKTWVNQHMNSRQK